MCKHPRQGTLFLVVGVFCSDFSENPPIFSSESQLEQTDVTSLTLPFPQGCRLPAHALLVSSSPFRVVYIPRPGDCARGFAWGVIGGNS